MTGPVHSPVLLTNGVYMNFFRTGIILVAVCRYITFAQEGLVSQPQLFIQQSNYITFKSTNVNSSKEAVSFDGTFIILGKGVYGHFDMAAFDNSGKVIQISTSGNQNWRSDQGSKLKTVNLTMSNCNPAKVEVSFHEMRVNPNVGACKP